MFLIGLLLFLAADVAGQDQESRIPHISTDVREMPDKKHGIRYYMPTVVSKLVDSAIERNLEKTKGKLRFEIKLVQIKDTIELYGYKSLVQMRGKRAYKRSVNNLLTKYSNRYIVSNGEIIPVYFASDLRFTFANFATTHFTFYIKFYSDTSNIDRVLEINLE